MLIRVLIVVGVLFEDKTKESEQKKTTEIEAGKLYFKKLPLFSRLERTSALTNAWVHQEIPTWSFVFMTHPLEKFRIGNIPTAFYVPEYVSEEEEKNLLKNVSQYRS